MCSLIHICECVNTTPQTPYDPFHFHDLCATRHCVDCIHDSNATVLANSKEEPTCNHSTTQVMDVLTDIDILAMTHTLCSQWQTQRQQ